MADYSSPKPIDPIDYRRGYFLRVTCDCGRREILALDDLRRRYRLPGDLAIYRLIGRLRCRSCRQRPVFADVSARPRF